MNVVFITGNANKVEALSKWLVTRLKHKSIDIDELQELNPYKAIEHKVRSAYKLVGSPVLVEDVSLEFTTLGRLPGTFVKWYIQEAGLEKMCQMLDAFEDRSAVARVIYGFFDGQETRFFEGVIKGKIAPKPIGKSGFGWDSIFIPEGSQKTYAELDGEELANYSVRNLAVKKLKLFLDNLEA